MTEEALQLTCEKCGGKYEKPSIFQKYLRETKNNVFFKWCLSFCDTCRREKERGSLKSFPSILAKLAQSFQS